MATGLPGNTMPGSPETLRGFNSSFVDVANIFLFFIYAVMPIGRCAPVSLECSANTVICGPVCGWLAPTSLATVRLAPAGVTVGGPYLR